MDVYFAVFNCHENDALNKAISMFKEIYGQQRLEKCIQPFIDQGIMSIFNQSPNRSTKFFCLYIHRVVNAS